MNPFFSLHIYVSHQLVLEDRSWFYLLEKNDFPFHFLAFINSLELFFCSRNTVKFLWYLQTVGVSIGVFNMQILFSLPHCCYFMDICSYNLIASWSMMSPEPWVYIVNVSHEDWYHTLICSLHFNHLWIFRMVFVYCPKTLLWWRMRTSLIVSIMIDINKVED